MDSTIIAAIIGAISTILGVWFSHYLSIRRDRINKELVNQQDNSKTNSSKEEIFHKEKIVNRKHYYQQSFNELASFLFKIDFLLVIIIWIGTGDALAIFSGFSIFLLFIANIPLLSIWLISKIIFVLCCE